MINIIKRLDEWRVPIRERLNPYLGQVRIKKISNPEFTIISNNCWGGHVYRYFDLPYLSPTVGLYFFADDYVRFVGNLQHYLSCPLDFIPVERSRHYLELNGQGTTHAPIGVLGNDVEIVFLHYHSEEEALQKWNRRCCRIHWGNIILKFSEQNCATVDHLRQVDALPFKKKLIFTTRDYGLESQVIFREWLNAKQVYNDTIHFRRYVDLVKLINGEDFKRNQ